MVKSPPANAGDVNRCGFNPWIRKIPWKRAWQPTPVFLPGESLGQRNLVGYSPRGGKESDTTEAIRHACIQGGFTCAVVCSLHAHTHTHIDKISSHRKVDILGQMKNQNIVLTFFSTFSPTFKVFFCFFFNYRHVLSKVGYVKTTFQHFLLLQENLQNIKGIQVLKHSSVLP